MSPQAGWYPDENDASVARYWDGSSWTGETRPAGGTPTESVDEVDAPAPPEAVDVDAPPPPPADEPSGADEEGLAEEADSGSRVPKWAWAAGAGAVVLIALALVFFVFGGDDSSDNEVDAGGGGEASAESAQLEMPDLVGSTEDEARAELTALGVDESDIDVTDQEHMDQPGTVVEQVPSPGSRVSGAVNLIVAEPVPEVPDFVGGDLSEVEAWAEDRGITVVATEVADDEAEDGSVLKTTPAAGADPSIEIAVDVAVAPDTQALATIEPVNVDAYGFETGDADLGGDLIANSLMISPDDSGFAGPEQNVSIVEYDLSRDWTRLTAMVGVRDDTPSGIRLRFVIDADGREVYNQTLTVGDLEDLDLDVSDVLRLVLRVSRVTDRGVDSVGVFADAQLTAPPGSTPPTESDTTDTTSDF